MEPAGTLAGPNDSVVLVRLTIRTTKQPSSRMKSLPAPSWTIPDGFIRLAAVAAVPSPEQPEVPLPAIVVITPRLLSERTRWLFQSAISRDPSARSTACVG